MLCLLCAQYIMQSRLLSLLKWREAEKAPRSPERKVVVLVGLEKYALRRKE